jgi:tetratricopeptide (TPR) repeat protein
VRFIVLFLFSALCAAHAAESAGKSRLRESLAKAEQEHGKEAPEVAARLSELASHLEAADSFQEAEALYRRALAIREKVSGVIPDDLESSLNNLADLLRQTGQEKEALGLYQRLLSCIEKRPDGAMSLEAANCLGSKAELLLSMHQSQSAFVEYLELLKLHEKLSGLSHIAVSSKLNKAQDLRENILTGRGSVPLYQQALQFHEEAVGAENADLATCHSIMAGLLLFQARNAEAEPVLRRALEIRTSIMRPKHPLTAQVAYTLAELLERTQRRKEALPFYRQALPVQEKALGPDAAITCACRVQLAQLLSEQNLHQEALPLQQRIVENIERTKGPEDHSLFSHLNHLASTLHSLRRFPEAEAAYRKELLVAEKAFGPDNSMITGSLSMIAQTLSDMERWKDAVPFLRRKLAVHEKNLGKVHETVAVDLRVLAGYLVKAGEPREAEPLLRSSLVILEKTKGPEDAQVAVVLKHLADLLCDVEPREAEKLYLRAIKVSKKSMGAGHSFTREIAEHYEALRQTLKKKDTKDEGLRAALKLNGKVWDESTAVAFLKKQLSNLPAAKFTETDAAKLVQQMKGNSLALAMAAACITEQKLTLAEYVKRWDQESAGLKETTAPNEASPNRILVVTWQLSAKCLTPTARALMALLPWLGEEAVPLPFFTEHAKLVADAANEKSPDAKVEAGFDELERHALITQEPLSITCPRSLQALLRLQSGAEFLGRATSLMHAVVAKDPATQRMWPREVWEPALPHVSRVLEFQRQFNDKAGDAEITRSLLNDCAEFLHYKAQYSEATPLLDLTEQLLLRALKLAEENPATQQADRIVALDKIGAVLHHSKRDEDAAVFYRRSLELCEKTHGPESLKTADSLDRLALTLAPTKQGRDATPLLRRSLAIREKALGPMDREVALSLGRLAFQLNTGDTIKEAEQLYRRALVIEEKIYGAEHPALIPQLTSLGNLLRAQQRDAEAEPVFKRIRLIRVNARINGPPPAPAGARKTPAAQ